MGDQRWTGMLKNVQRALSDLAIAYTLDDSGASIGKRYSRNDELGIPFAMTVDFDSLEDGKSVTLRERDTMVQIRIPNFEEVALLLAALSSGRELWTDVMKRYTIVKGGEA